MRWRTRQRVEKTDLETATISALEQFENKQYAEELVDRGISCILYLGFAFKGKNVLIVRKFK